MKDGPTTSQTTADLTEFTFVIEYRVIAQPEKISVIARNIDDAKQIAHRLFVDGHAGACVIYSIEETCK